MTGCFRMISASGRNATAEAVVSGIYNISLKNNVLKFFENQVLYSKTIAYSIWHIFRIEDIVVHTVINKDKQVFFAGNYQERINSHIITTGNELIKQQIADFSKQLNLEELYSYIFEVRKALRKCLN